MFKREIIEIIHNSGYEITPDALDLLNLNKEPINFLKALIEKLNNLPNKPFLITIDLIKKSTLGDYHSIELTKYKEREVKEEKFESKVKNIQQDIEILKDATGRLYGTGKVDDFKKLFVSRYKKLYLLLLKRTDVNGTTPISEVKKAREGDFKIIGIIQDKKESSSKNIRLTLEDLSGNISVIIQNKEKELLNKALKILHDQVICIHGSLWKNNTLMVKEIIFPDIPNKNNKKFAEIPIYAALISDTHFGSKQFKKDSFENFLDWINGKSGNAEQKVIASNLKYLIIAGDIIDGIGVYPSQKEDLDIINIYKQYNFAADYLKQIPEHISIIIIPGGAHDAIRKALPQPAIPKKYAKRLYELKNTIMLGNPAFIKLHGVSFLIYHGDSFDDIISSIPGLSYEHPELAMEQFLICRHLAPAYGQKTGLSPEHEDWLVIEEVPDIIHCGHAHINGYKEYKGVKLINSGCFQNLTSFQKEKGIYPTPGMVPVINLQTLKVKILKF
ncbi:MAG: DNA-directed DNA polymerase II small subunit [Candidatus Helarchaeota archaeon]